MSQIVTGTVKWFDAGKSYGFISQDAGEDVFVHKSGVRFGIPEKGQRVEFEIQKGARGPKAVNVRSMPNSTANQPTEQ